MSDSLRIIFAGTPDFAARHLDALIQSEHNVVGVLTMPDRPAGRGKKITAGPVKELAQQHDIPVFQPSTLRKEENHQWIRDQQADIMIVVAYGMILPQAVLDIPRLGCLNVHGSLLPAWRGAAPIQRALWAGDTKTGVTIMQMDAGLDTGDMCVIERLPIAAGDTTASLQDKLAALGGRLIVEALEMAACGGLSRTPQPADGVSYAHKIEKAESLIDWSESAEVIARRLRAFNPFPGGATSLGGEAIKVWEAEAQQGSGAPGSVLSADARGVRVACGSGVLNMTLLQRAGGKRLAAGDFLRGFELPAGAQLGEGAGEV